MGRYGRWKQVVVVVLAVGMIAPLSLHARYQPKPGFNLFSQEQEVEIGKQEAAKVDKSMPLVTDPALNRYIQRLGARLADKAPAEYPYTFKIVNQKEINAFALPGGPVYLNLGTIQAADNESQLAGVLAHEIAHVVMRHATNQASKQMFVQLPLAVLGGRLGTGMAGQLARLGISFGASSVFLQYSRDAEQQADLVGAGIMFDAGFDPQGMVTFFRKLEEEGGRGGPQFFQSHPNPGNRAEAVAREVRSLGRASYSRDSADFRDIKRRVGGMKALSGKEIQQQQNDNSRDSASSGDIWAGDQYLTFDHRNFRVSYPGNWQVFGDRNSAVTIAPQAGVSQDAVAYGAIISEFQPEGRNVTLEDATRQLLEQLHVSNPDLRRVGRDESMRINGLPARSVVLVGPSPITGSDARALSERDWLVTMPQRDGSLLYFIFIAPQRDFDRLQDAFEKMLKSVRVK